MSEGAARDESWFVELFKLLGEVLRPAADFTVRATNWSIAQARAYVTLVWRSAIRIGLLCIVATALAVIGAFSNQNWLVSLSLIFAALTLVALLFLSFPILVLAAKFSELQSVQRAARFGIWILTWLFGMALLISIVPLSPAGVGIVLLASLVLSLLCVATGAKPNLDKIRARAAGLVVVTILIAFAQQALPQVSASVTRVVGSLDHTAARWLNVEFLPPRGSRFGSPEECWNAVFFDQDGTELYWYERTAEGKIALFDRGGASPFTRRKLDAATPDVRDELCRAMQAEAAVMLEDRRRTLEAGRDQQAPAAESTQPLASAARAATNVVGAGVDLDSPVASATVGPSPSEVREAEIAAVESIVRTNVPRTFKAQPEWTRALVGKRITIRYSAVSRELAAACVQRLRSLGLEVVLDPAIGSSTGASPSIEYNQSDIHAASGLNALVGDLARLDLNSHRALVPLQINLP